MISKFAVHGRDRAEAIGRMRRALLEYEVGGIKTTLPFFRSVMEDQEFMDGKLDTGFISRFNARHPQSLLDEMISDMAIVAAALRYSKDAVFSNQKPNGTDAGPGKWVLAGRTALHDRYPGKKKE